MNMLLSWVIGIGMAARGGNKRSDVTWDEIRDRLVEISESGGSVTIQLLDGDSDPSVMLQAICEKRLFLVTLADLDNEDGDVRTLWDESVKKYDIEVGGNYWDSRTVTQDFEQVIRVFEAFFKEGDVPEGLMV